MHPGTPPTVVPNRFRGSIAEVMRNRYVLLGGLCVLFSVYAFSVTMIGPLLPVLMGRYGLDLAQGGLLDSARSLGGVIAALLGGVVLDRVSKRGMVIGAFAAYAVSLFFVRFEPPYLLLLTFFFLIGTSTRLVDTASNALTADLFSDRPGTALNILHAMFGIGALAGPIYARIVLSTVGGWRSAYEILAFACAALLAAFIVVTKLATPGRGGAAPGSIAGATENRRSYVADRQIARESRAALRPALQAMTQQAAVGPTVRPGALQLLGRLPILMVLGVMFLYGGSQAGLTVWLPTYAIDRLGATSDTGAAAVSFMWAGIVLSRIVSTRLVRHAPEATIVVAGLTVGTIAAAIGLLLGSVPILLASMFVTGLTTGATIPLIVSLACSCASGATGAATSLIFLVASLSRILFSWLVGVVAQHGSFVAAISINWVVLLAALCFAIPLARRAVIHEGADAPQT